MKDGTYKIPFLNDYHTHASFALALRNSLDVRPIKDIKVAMEMIKNLDEDMNVVIGWTFGNQKRDEIEECNPLLIVDASMHNYIMNQKAKDILIKDFPEIVANIENLEWIEHNLYTMIQFIPQIKKVSDEDINEFFDFMLKENQIYSMEDLLLPNTEHIDLFEKNGYADRIKYWLDVESFKKLPAEYKNKIEGLKIWLDGAISPGTAAINGYCNPEFDGGLKLISDEELISILKYAASENKAVAAHALGEIAIDQIVDIVEKENIKLPCLRIEHAQYISLDVAKRCKKLGIILSMQVCFSEESVLFKGKLKDETLAGNNPFRMLIDEAGFVPGKDLLFGSDGMPYGASCALRNAFFPPIENQILTLDEFVKGYCIDTMNKGHISFEIENQKVINVKTHIK